MSHDGDRRRGGIPIYPPSIRISSSRAESDYGRIAGGAQKQSVLADYPSVAFFSQGSRSRSTRSRRVTQPWKQARGREPVDRIRTDKRAYDRLRLPLGYSDAQNLPIGRPLPSMAAQFRGSATLLDSFPKRSRQVFR